MKPALNRTVPRNRFQPCSRGQTVYASPGVLSTLEVLQRYRYLPSHYVSTLAALSYTYCKSTLFPHLFHEGFVFYHSEGIQSYNARYRQPRHSNHKEERTIPARQRPLRISAKNQGA